ncbi:unnamed protein product [Spirodela intermedia]|uniref:Uncharacterized protein n=1 Tax=Spirodela intermedia TaxID=51605 RepID=A0A7I8I9D3_SPIIN|nr:unnamed protein product [Spirodela intermedia]CAA6654306.1 unnamed protein product [Spirodela intermedia]
MASLGSCGTARYLVLHTLPPVSPWFSDHTCKTNLEVDARKRKVIVRLFAGRGGAGGERASNHDLQAEAARAASIRFNESLRPDPLLIDLYAGCLLSSGDRPEDGGKEQYSVPVGSLSPCHYTLATKFIDEKLLSLVRGVDGVKQIVLFTDGFDTRPYRVKWPPRTLIYDVSVESVFSTAIRKLESVGAKIMKTCKHIHVPSESPDLQAALCSEGFNGGNPSLWVFQGFPVTTLATFKEILFLVSNLAMKGSIFVGELPGWLVDTETGNKITAQKGVDKIFMSHGFRVKIIDYHEIAKEFHMEDWRKEFLRMEDEGDEDGFEDLI